MPGRPHNPPRPLVPAASPGSPPASAHESSPAGPHLENPADIAESTQPHDEDGVMEDMATLAVNPGYLDGVSGATAPHGVPQGSAHFSEMEDPTIMLEL